MEQKNYEKELPAGYREVYTIDAADKKIGLLLNLIGGLLSVGILALAIWGIGSFSFDAKALMLRLAVAGVTIFVYLVLHELTHGAAYKLLTHQKLKFGFTATVAFCGVPEIYVYRKTALISLLAPFLVFNLVFGLPMLLLPNPLDRVTSAFLFALHFGGCIGDLYDTFLYLTRFRDPKTLMRDTGPKQSFYLPN